MVPFASSTLPDEGLREALREGEARYKFLAENVPVQIWTALPDGRLDYVTEQTARHFGLTAERLLDEGWQNVLHPDDLPRAVARWTEALRTGEPYEVEFRLKLADGTYAHHLARAVAQRNADGSILRWYGTNTNIDEQRALIAERDRLLETAETNRAAADLASRAKDEFLATASHELRTPLNAILGWARMLRSGQLDAATAARAAETIERNAKVQVRLIEDILDGSRMITGKLQVERRPVELGALVQASLDAVRPDAEAKGVALTLEQAPGPHAIAGDPERLAQVLWNLVSNAIKFTPRGGTIHVRLERDDGSVILVVEDTGTGITADFLPHVFDRFRQAEGSTSRRHGGLGLGLALVRHLVLAHGGAVDAASEGQGRGATFTVTLPLATSDAPTTAASWPVPPVDEASALDFAGVHVLVVDDEVDARDLVATVLRTRGATVTTARNAAEALTHLASSTFALLVSDVGMPGTDGYTLMRRVRSDGRTIRSIALTAYTREEDRRLALEAGFDEHVAKPVEPAALLCIVANALARR